MECVLYDDCSLNAANDKPDKKEDPIVILLSLARVGFSEDGKKLALNKFLCCVMLFHYLIIFYDIMLSNLFGGL